MTRKDYQLIASAIQINRTENDSNEVTNVIDSIVVALADRMEAENKRFNYSKFVEACSIKE